MAYGSQEVVYIDESGFEQTTFRPYGWAEQGKKVYGERDGKSRQRTSWIAGKRGSQLLAPVLFTGTTYSLSTGQKTERVEKSGELVVKIGENRA